MSIAAGPIRTILFVPGDRERWVGPARASGTDAIVFDIEDAVAASEIDRARAIVRTALDEFGSEQPRLFVRVAPPSSPTIEGDLDAVVCPGLSGIMLPLVTTPEEVRSVADRLDVLEAKRGMPVGSTILVPLVETAHAARFSYEVAMSSKRIAYMGGGVSRSGDIARAIGYRWTPEGNETLLLRSWVLLNVRAAGIAYPISGMWGIVDDLDGLRRFAEQTRGLGYQGMMAIHPSHIPVINDVFTPTEREIAHWRETIEVMRSWQEKGVGVLRFHGEVLDEAHVKTAELGLELASRLGLISAGE